MKGAFAAFLALVAAVGLLYVHSSDVANDGRGVSEFRLLHKAAAAAREHKPLYAEDRGLRDPEFFNKPAIDPATGGPKPLVDSDGDLLSTESYIPKGEVFLYPPYFSLMLLPLSFIKSFETAALSWYWLTAVLMLLTLLFTAYTLGGKLGGGKALIIVPVIIAVPLTVWYLPTQNTAVLALFFVIGGLALYRAGQDALAGLLSSLALFSPLGVIFFVYYLLKRAWAAVIGVLVGAIIWFAILPGVYFGYQPAVDETRGYVGAVLTPLPREMLSTDTILTTDNHSLWAATKRNEAAISSFLADTFPPADPDAGESSLPIKTETLFVIVGAFVAFATLASLWRKHRDRWQTIVGLEGGLAIAAYLVLAPVTPASVAILAVVPLMGCAYAVRLGDVKTFAYHVTYVGLVVAAEFFYIAYMWNVTIALGAIFAALFVLWLALLSGVGQFRSQLTRARSVLEGGPRPSTEKPIELVPVKARGDEKEEKKEKEAKSKLGGVIPMPSFVWKKEKLEGTTGVETDLPKPDSTPVELIPDDGKEDDGKSDKIKLD